MSLFFSHEIEKLVLSGILSYPNMFLEDFSRFLSEDDFSSDIAKLTFSTLRRAIFENPEERPNRVFVAEKMKAISSFLRDSISPEDYLDAIFLVKTTNSEFKQSVQHLKTLSQKREMAEVCDKVKKKLINSPEMKFQDVNRLVESEFFSKINAYYDTEDFVDLYESMYERAEKLAANPVFDLGLKTPYDTFNESYGGFQPGNVYVFCARPKQGKSTFLTSTIKKMSVEMHRVPSLILDTEMQEDECGDRILASATSIPLFDVRTGLWGQHKQHSESFKRQKELYPQQKGLLYHRNTANMPIDEVVSLIKKWYYTKIGKGKPCIVCYDYIKTTGERISDSNKEYQVIGDKVNRLKELCSKEVKAPLLTAMQLNRSGDGAKGEQSDDSTAISLSDRALWFASYVGIFRRKTLKELDEYGDGFGSHKLIHIESRYQGRNAKGHVDYVRTHNGKFVKNFTNFNISNFNVKEVGSAEEMFKKLSFKMGAKLPEDPM